MRQSDNCLSAVRMGLISGILLLGMVFFSHQAEAFRWKRPHAEVFRCGDTLLKGYHKLNENLTCVSGGDGPALTLESGVNLDLNGYTVNCNDPDRVGIELAGRNARVRNGTIINCYNGVEIGGDGHHKVFNLIVENNDREGIRVKSVHNNVINSEARFNGRRGFKIDNDGNNLVNCLAEINGQQGFDIDEGRYNKIINSAAFDNCRDGIEIENGGSSNLLMNNYVRDNGNRSTCEERFGLEYKPWAYSGIDITKGAEKNIVFNNKTSGNQGCDGEDCCNGDGCDTRDRNLWDENIDAAGSCDSTNRWIDNRVYGIRVDPGCRPTL
jgi:hypothetical protein